MSPRLEQEDRVVRSAGETSTDYPSLKIVQRKEYWWKINRNHHHRHYRHLHMDNLCHLCSCYFSVNLVNSTPTTYLFCMEVIFIFQVQNKPSDDTEGHHKTFVTKVNIFNYIPNSHLHLQEGNILQKGTYICKTRGDQKRSSFLGGIEYDLPISPFFFCWIAVFSFLFVIGQTEGVWALIENRYRQTFLTPPTGTEPQTLQHFIFYLTQFIFFSSSLYIKVYVGQNYTTPPVWMEFG